VADGTGPYALRVSWAVAIQAAIIPDAAVLPFARMLIGLAIGAYSAIATAYIAE